MVSFFCAAALRRQPHVLLRCITGIPRSPPSFLSIASPAFLAYSLFLLRYIVRGLCSCGRCAHRISLQEAAQREISAFQQLKDSVDVFESVRLDRDEAVVRQKAAVDESETLRAKLQEYVDGGIERTKQQVSHHRSEATRRQASLVAALNESQDSVTQVRLASLHATTNAPSHDRPFLN